MKRIVVNLNEKKAYEYQQAAQKLGLSVEAYATLVLSRLSVDDLMIEPEAEIVEEVQVYYHDQIMSREKYEALKKDILSDYAELYKRLA